MCEAQAPLGEALLLCFAGSILQGMNSVIYFAGFVCDYSHAELWLRYLNAMWIVALAAFLIYMFVIRRSKNLNRRKGGVILLIVASFLVWHVAYSLSLNGGFLSSCSLPMFEHSSPEDRAKDVEFVPVDPGSEDYLLDDD